MIYAISDIHGDLSRAKELLGAAGVIDNVGRWAAGDSTLVVGGDSTDRGPDGIGTLRYLKGLQEQATEAGGRLIHLIGNHDAMILSMALGNRRSDDIWIFNRNGGDQLEVVKLIEDPELLEWMQTFSLIARVDSYLFQHCDQYTIYSTAMGGRETRTHSPTPAEHIERMNNYGKLKLLTWEGAWEMFYNMTDERHWNGDLNLMTQYLEVFKARAVIHGHTRNGAETHVWYHGNLVCNIDATLSIGYRPHPDRGCVLVLDSPGHDILT